MLWKLEKIGWVEMPMRFARDLAFSASTPSSLTRRKASSTISSLVVLTFGGIMPSLQ